MTGSIPFLQIEPTTRCNFTCGFCAGRAMPQVDMDFEHFKQIIAAAGEIRHVELQGEGEPLMHPRFFDMLAFIREKHPRARVSFITNGSLFTRQNIARILDCRVDKIYVSIEAASAEDFQRIRGGKLERVARGLRHLLEARKARELALPEVGMTVTVLKSTVSEINAIGALYRELNLDGGLMIQPLQNMAAYSRFYSSSMMAEVPDRQDMAALKGLIASDKPLLDTFARPMRRPGFYQDLLSSVENPAQTCAWLERGLYVAADGTACSCCFIKDSERYGLGLMGRESMAAILSARATLLKALRQGQAPSQCRQCPTAGSILHARQNG